MDRMNPDALPPAAGLSQVVVTEAAKTAYISGQVALNAQGDLVGAGDFRAQTEQVVRNVSAALGALGEGAKLAKLTIYVVNLDAAAHGPVLADVVDLAVWEHPAATLISVAGLARPELLIEIEAIAVIA